MKAFEVKTMERKTSFTRQAVREAILAAYNNTVIVHKKPKGKKRAAKKTAVTLVAK